ncbi:MAG: fused MFS/spermidine synthase [Planctomycetota bacterium]|nr:fused MFS/spermidine synthase [Planctomycetota bacterium]
MSLRALALFCFFLSGATGLLYEVLWTRLLGATIGNTHFSITMVVAVFMGGLAAGSYLGGRAADRSRNPLRLYGVLNLVGALLCLAVVPASKLGQPFFAWLYQFHDGTPEAPPLLASRIVFSALLILAPTTCMGATLPVLSRFFATRLGEVGFTVGRLYSINTFGAVVGVFSAGFWAMEHLGVWGTTLLAVGIDVVIGLLIIFAARGQTRAAHDPTRGGGDTMASGPESDDARAGARPATAGTRLPPEVRLAVLAFALSGFANMMLQIAWTKAIVQTIGNSTYAFSLIVTLFILGIGVGGGVMTLVVDRLRNLGLVLGVVITLTGLLVSATVPLLGHFPIWGARLFDAVDEPSYGKFLTIKIFMVAVVILPSTTLMGSVFPLVGKIRTQAIESVGSAVGSAYFANTLGSILGTLAAGFLFVPLFGHVYWTLYLGAAISLFLGLYLVVRSSRLAPSWRLALAGGVALVTLVPSYVFRPHGVLASDTHLWDPAVTTLGPYLYFRGSYYKDRQSGEVRSVKELVDIRRRANIVRWYREGIHAPVAVIENPKGGLAMRISGKVDASTPRPGEYNSDLPHQIMAGHLPMTLHPEPRDVLTLGLGGGVTLGTLTLYPIDGVDSLEISPEVIEAARDFFSGPNRGALGDSPRAPVRNVVGDGRNHLLYTRKRYDVISSLPSNPWIAGIGNLFTVEFFELCAERLKPGGIVCIWIPKINMRTEDMKTVVRTFVRVFDEHAQFWDLGYDCLLIGSDRPIVFDGARLARLLDKPEIRSDLASLGIVDARTFLRHYRSDLVAMRRFAGDGPVNTDSLPVLEFSCPRGLYGHHLDTYRDMAFGEYSPLSAEWIHNMDPLIDEARAYRDAFRRYQLADAYSLDHETELARSRPDPGKLRKLSGKVMDGFYNLHELLLERPDPWLYDRAMSRARLVFPGKAKELPGLIVDQLILASQLNRDVKLRIAVLENVPSYAARHPRILEELVKQYQKTGDFARGLEVFRSILDKNPDDVFVLQAFALLHVHSRQLLEAESLLNRALTVTTDARILSSIHNNLGYAYRIAGRADLARRHLDAALDLDPENQNARGQLEALDAGGQKTR